MGCLRTTLAILVVLFHAGGLGAPELPLPNGRLAVQMFYVVSGFYMCLILNEKYRGAGTTWLFYSNRVLRLWPPILLVNLLILLQFLVMGEAYLFRLRAGLGDTLALLAGFELTTLAYLAAVNLLVLGQDSLWFIGIDTTGALVFAPFPDHPAHNGSSFSLNHPLFTVAIEAAFYLVSPFVLRRGWRLVLGLAGLGALYHLGLRALGLYGVAWSYHLFLSAAYFYFLGATSYYLYRKLRDRGLLDLLAGHRRLTIAGLGLGLAVMHLLALHAPVAGLLMAPVLVLLIPVLFHESRASVGDRLIGELSFGVYLVHYPLLLLLRDPLSPAALGIAGCLLSLAAATVLHLALERPIDRWRQRRARAAQPQPVRHRPQPALVAVRSSRRS